MKSYKAKILIVEDDSIAAAQLKKMISNLGFDVAGSADSGNDAIKKTAKLKPDLILMDICLSCEMDGIDTAGRIQADYSVPVIFLTGDADDVTIKRAQECNPYGYIIKPISMAMLNAAIKTALHRCELEKQNAAIKGELLAHQVGLEIQNEQLRKTQEELSVSKERYFDLFDLAPAGYFSLNEKGIIMEANLTAASLLDVSKDSLINQPFYRYIFSEDQSVYLLYSKQLVNSWKPQSYEIRMARSDGTSFWVLLESSAAGIVNDKSMCRIIISNITDRKNAEESQKNVSSLLQSTLESTTDGILVVDLSGKVKSFNKKFGELWRIPQPLIDIGDDNILITFILDQLKEPDLFLAKVRDLYKKIDEESFDTIDFKDGRVFERYSRPQMIDDEIVGRVWNFRNVTEQKQLDIQIRKLLKAVEQSPATVVITDFNGTIEYVNRKFIELTGYSSEEAIGQNPQILQSGNTPVELYKELWGTITSGKEWQGTFQNKKKNGELYWESASIAPILNENGVITNYIAIKEDITERKRAENLINEFSTRLEVAMNAADMAWWEMDVTTGNVIFDKRKTDMIGETPEKFKHYKDFMKLVHPDDCDSTMDAMKKHFKGLSDRYEAQYRILTKTGDYKWFYDIGSIVKKDSNNVPLKAVGIVIDISKRKKTEQQLNQEREFTNAILDNAGALILVLDREGRIRQFNHAAEKLSGYTFEEIEGKFPWDTFLPEEERDIVRNQAFEIFKNTPKKLEGVFTNHWVDKDGKRYLIDWTNTIQLGTDGKMELIISIGIDVTKRKQAEEAVIKRDERHKTILETAMNGFWLADTKGHLLEVNETYSKMSGYSEQELLSMRIPDLEAYEAEDDIAAHIQKVITAGEDSFETRHRRKDGSVYDVEISVQYQSGEEGRFIVFIHDITERKLSEKKLLIALQESDALREKAERTNLELDYARNLAESANRAKSEFLASMSHELRTPLNSILGFSQIMEMDDQKLDAKHREYIGYIKESGDHLLLMINDILDLAKIESRKFKLEKEPFDIGAMLSGFPDMMNAELKKRKIFMHRAIAPDIGMLNADEVRIRQVMYNLISNAIKFTEAGKNIGIEARGEDDNIIITVWDEGIGINKIDFDLIFKPFEQIRKRNAAYTGTGLGLSITHSLVEMHDGRIELESQPGKGSRFTVYLPGRLLMNDRIPDSAVHENISVPSPDVYKTANVLIVEDNELNQKLMESLLKEFGIGCRIASSGEEAVKIALSNRFDLILMDIDLPGINGIEAMKQIRISSDEKILIIALTAHTMKGDFERFLKEGVDDVLAKPIGLDKLKDIFNKYLPGFTFKNFVKRVPHKRETDHYNIESVSEAIGIPVNKLKPLMEHFFNDLMNTYIQNLSTAIAQREFESIRFQSHKFKGSAANFQFKACTDILSYIEQSAEKKVDADYGEQFEKLVACLNRYKEEIMPLIK